ncbi:MAG: hypothetical protein ACXAC7_00805 [Candidatus Hodarchaeales archaeon]|jgi:hypothetical protein
MSKDELFEDLRAKIAGEKATVEKNFKTIINEIKALGSEGQKQLTEELTRISTQAQTYESNQKWRETAIIYYKGGMVSQAFSADDHSVAGQWFSKSSEALVKLSQEYMTWNEIDRASAAIAIGSVLFFLIDDWSIKSFYNDFCNKYKSEIQQGKTASQSLWIPYDLVQCVQELNPEFLQRAESYAQASLLTETKISDPFREGIQDAINKAREAMVAQMKVPNIQSSGSLPKDVIFGEEFRISMKITNIGEGEARDVNATIDMPKDFNLLKGSIQEVIGNLNTNKSHEFEIECSCLPKEGELVVDYSIEGKISYLDVLNNRREVPIGPYPLIIRTFRKADELREALKVVEKDNAPAIEELKKLKTSQINSKDLISALLNTYQTLTKEIHEKIDKAEFDQAEARIDLTKLILNSIGSQSAQLIFAHEKTSERINKVKSVSEEIYKDSSEKLKSTEKILDDYEKKWIS